MNEESYYFDEMHNKNEFSHNTSISNKILIGSKIVLKNFSTKIYFTRTCEKKKSVS